MLTSPGLDGLPLEILQRIIAYGSALTAQSLTRVNKNFHSICSDPKVFLDIARSGNGKENVLYERSNDELSWWPSDSHDVNIVARWAVADQKAREDPPELSLTGADESIDTLCWLPELIVQDHNQAIAACPRHGVFSFPEGQKLDTELLTRAVFLSTCQSMLRRYPMISPSRAHFLRQPMDDEASGHSSTLSYHSSMFLKELERLIPYVQLDEWQPRDLLMDWQTAANPQSHDSTVRSADISCMTLGTMMPAILHYSLTKALNRRAVATPRAGYVNLFPPNTKTICFQAGYDGQAPPFSLRYTSEGTISIAPPHGHESVSPFLTRHLPAMTRASFLSHGEWIGYYCYVNYGSHVRWDPMMPRLRFTCSFECADHCALSARSLDEIGDFTLFGTVHKQSGMVQMTKRYDSGMTWPWVAVMTPFGIVGSWGSEGWGGWVWLWKKEWTANVESR